MSKTSVSHKRSEILWKSYLSDRKIETRDLLVDAYRPMVERIAREIMMKKPSNFDKEDLVQAGMIGLVMAIERFDPTKGAKFSTFAPLRIRGSIFDEINSMDWTPRLVRENIKMVIKAEEIFSKTHSGVPTDQEISDVIKTNFNKDLPPEKVKVARHQLTKTYIHAIDHETAVNHEEESKIHTTGASLEENISETFAHSEIREIIRNECTTFEKVVLYGIFYEEKSMKKIAEENKVSFTKVSEAKSSGFEKIKLKLAELSG